MALSSAVPVLPIDGVMPTSFNLSPKDSEVYWADSIGRSNTPGMEV
jgi:hypothetical protein